MDGLNINEDDGSARLVDTHTFNTDVSKLLEDLHNLEEWGDDDPAVLLQFSTTPAYARLVFKTASEQYLENIEIEADVNTRHRMWVNLLHTTANMRSINSAHVDDLPLPREP